MPRYFFHLELDDRVLLDHEGWELPNLAAARSRALQVARRLRSAGVAGVHEPSTGLSHHRHRSGAPLHRTIRRSG
jgi:hypothetical protein